MPFQVADASRWTPHFRFRAAHGLVREPGAETHTDADVGCELVVDGERMVTDGSEGGLIMGVMPASHPT